MKRRAVLLITIIGVFLLAGCFKLTPVSQFETEDAVFVLRNGVIEVTANRQLSGLDVFMKAVVKESDVISNGTFSIVKQLEDGTAIATAIGGEYFSKGETVMTIRGGFEDLKTLGIETIGVRLEEEYGPQSQLPVDGVYVQDTWVQSDTSDCFFMIGARDIDSTRPVVGIDLVLSYNTNHITVTEVESLIGDGVIKDFDISTSGKIKISIAFDDASTFKITAPTNLFQVNFTSKNVKVTSEVSFDSSQFIVYTGDQEKPHDEVPASESTGFITIGNPVLLGDFDLSGGVGLADLLLFKPYYRTSSGDGDFDSFYDIGPAVKAYGGDWANIYTEAKPDSAIDLFDLVILAQNYEETKPDGFNYVKTLDELNAAIASDSFTSIVFGSNISGTPNEVGRLVDINLNGYTLTGNLSFDTGDSGTINLYAGTITGDLTVSAPNATFNNYANVTGTVTINGVSEDTWNEYPNNNTLIWYAAGGTLHIHGGAGQVTFNATGTVYGGARILSGTVNVQGMVFSGGLPENMKKVFNATKNSQYDTIQTAINAADPGDTIFVGAGTYAEQLVIEKPLTLKGPNAGTHGFSDNRIPEAKLVFPDEPVYFDSPLEDVPLVWRVLVEIGSENVTVDGFSFSNEGSFSEIQYMGGVFSYKGSLKVTNNAFEGFTTAIKTDIPINTEYIKNVEISYNYVHDNVRWTNSSIYIQGAGADVFENVTKDVGNSIQIQPYSNPNAGSVHDNQFESWLLGIWYNYAEKGSGEWTITDNTLTAASYPTVAEPKNWRGIDVQTFGSSGSEDAPRVEFRVNTIDAANIIDEDRFDTVTGIRMSSPVSDDAEAVFKNNIFINVRTGALRQDGTLNLETILSNNTFPEGFVVNEAGDMIGKFKVTNTTKKKGYDTIQAAINAADAGDVIEVAEGTHTIDSQININKAVTLRGVGTNEEWKTKLLVSGTKTLNIQAASTIENLEIEKTDNEGSVIYIGSNGVTIRSNKIHGQYTMGDPKTSRGMEIAASTGLLIENNTIYNLRQPAYINVVTGTVKNNDVFGTRGWVVVSESNITFEENTWGDGSVPNYYDIAIIRNPGAVVNNYVNFVEISKNNNDAAVENQFYSPAQLSVVFVDKNTVSTGNNGSFYDPYKTIGEAVARVAPGGTIRVAAGEYGEVFSISKSLTIQGAGPEATIINGDPDNHSITLSNASGVTIKDMGFDFGVPAIGLDGKVAIQMNNTNSNINIENCHFKDGYYVTIQGKADNLTVSDCSIANVKSGINLQYGTNMTVENTDISVVAQSETNDTYCVRFGSETGTANGISITGCEFSVNKSGLTATAGTYHSAIIVRAAATGTLAANESKILGEVVNLSSTNINATNNWWGQATGPEEGQIKGTGTVDFVPYYTNEEMTTLSE